MQVQPPAMPHLPAPGLSLNGRHDEAAAAARAGTAFEALLVTRLLKVARGARLGDDLMGSNDQIRDLVDETRGRSIAEAAPLGLARLLAKGAGK